MYVGLVRHCTIYVLRRKIVYFCFSVDRFSQSQRDSYRKKTVLNLCVRNSINGLTSKADINLHLSRGHVSRGNFSLKLATQRCYRGGVFLRPPLEISLKQKTCSDWFILTKLRCRLRWTCHTQRLVSQVWKKLRIVLLYLQLARQHFVELQVAKMGFYTWNLSGNLQCSVCCDAGCKTNCPV